MSTLICDDGSQFVLRCYRERLSSKNLATLRGELQLIAQTNGHYARLFKQGNGQVEAVVSQDPGYLFAETVWQYFSRIDNLIYCESIIEAGEIQILAVIVQNGHIYLDGQLDLQEWRQLMASLSMSSRQFEVHQVGEIELPDNIVGDRNIRDTSILPELLKLPQFQLVSPERAIQLAKIKQYSPLKITLLVAILIGAVTWMLWPTDVIDNHYVASPYTQMLKFLRIKDPQLVLHEVAYKIQETYGLLGWQPTELHYDNGTIALQMHSLGLPTASLFQWASRHHRQVSLASEGAIMSVMTKVPDSLGVSKLQGSQRSLSQLIDRTMLLFAQKSVAIGHVTNHQLVDETEVNINVSQISPDVLALLGDQLFGLPIKLETVQLGIHNGLLSGILRFKLFGAGAQFAKATRG